MIWLQRMLSKSIPSLVFALAIVWSSSPGAQSRRIVITNVTVIDTVSARALANHTVIVDNDRIVTVAPNGSVPAGAQRIDGRGKFLIPGLWDMHAHHQLTGEESLPVFVAAGVTGTRDMGGDLEAILSLRARTASGELLGPTIVAAGPILDNRPAFPFRLTVRNADEGRTAVVTLKQRGVDLIKVHDGTPPDAYFAIADEARRQGLPVAGHLPRGVTLEEAVAAGQRSIEHLAGLRLLNSCSTPAGYSAEQCRPLFALLAKAGVWQTPTLVNWRKMFTLDTPAGDQDGDHVAYLSAGVREFLAMNRKMSKISEQGVRDMVQAAKTAASQISDMNRAGVGILAGCDGMVAGFCIHDELALMVEGGMSAAAALQTATINPARYLGREAESGSVAVGRRADLVLLDANPLDDVHAVSRIAAVVLGGRLLDRQALDATLATARRRLQTEKPAPLK